MKQFFRLISYLKNYKGYVLLSILSNILCVFFSFFSLTLIAPFTAVLFGLQGPDSSGDTHAFLKQAYAIIRSVQTEYGSFKALAFTAALFFILAIFSNLFRYLGAFFLAPARSGAIREIRDNFYCALMNHPLGFFSENKRGDMLERATSDINETEWAIMSSLYGIVKDPVNVIFFLTALISLNAPLVLFVLLILPAMFYVVSRIGRKIKKYSYSGQAQLGDLMSVTEETIDGIRVIKSFNKIDRMFGDFRKRNRSYTNRQNKIYFLRDLASPVTEFLSVLAILPVILYGGIEVFQGKMSADIMVLFLLLFIRLISPAKAVVTAFYNIQKGCAALERISEIVNYNGSDGINGYGNSTATDISIDVGITFDKVSFKYPDTDEYALKDVSFKIEKGKTVALVGFSGAGKTTVADLLMRFYDACSGEITIDGKNITKIEPEKVRKLFGYVSQLPFVWNDTIENNIRFGKEDVTFQEVVEAAKKAKIDDFITSLPDGYNTTAGDAGVRISGGERQRTVIARAILHNAPVLILDEATSALDNISEKDVQEAISILMKGRTSIVIAHRLSTIIDADEIIVIDRGTIVQKGTHEELINRDGVYSRLFAGQAVLTCFCDTKM
ncbi:MAG: ABC transporter ATP-binding protein/permease [Bacteroidales bacterium]|jgi:subfamily B ATP-binding cassette protein MsbA|nr:ABC transporter ATP-binding protein/permease [Bacteroidales bacterium]